MSMLETNLTSIKDLRNNFSSIVSDAENFMKGTEIEFQPLCHTRLRKHKMRGEIADDEPIMDPKDSFKVETFYASIDMAITQMKERFVGEDNATTLMLLRDLSLLSLKRLSEVRKKGLPEDAFTSFSSIYGKYVNVDEARKEYIAFPSCFEELGKTVDLPRHLHSENKWIVDSDIDSEKDPNSSDDGVSDDNEDLGISKPSNVGSLPEIFKIFCKSKLKTVFPNLYSLLKIAVTLPVTSVTTERSFSKLKRVKTDLRSTIGGDRLEGLITIASEWDISIDYEKVIDIFASYSSVLTENRML